MANYRGGEREMSSHGAGLVKAIKEGRTERQRSRNFKQKLIFTGVQAGLTGARGIASYLDHEKKEDEAHEQDKAEYIAAPLKAYKPMKAEATDAKLPGWLTGGQSDRTELGIDKSVTDAMRKDPVDSNNPYDTLATRAYGADVEDDEPAVTWGTSKKKTGRGMMGSQ